MNTDKVYRFLKEHTQGMDAIYEDYLNRLIGERGVNLLVENGLLESCGVINNRRLFVICEKPE